MKRVLDFSFAWVQIATFFKKLRFGLSQTQNIVNFLIYALFGLQKAQTNAHLVTRPVFLSQWTLFHPKQSQLKQSSWLYPGGNMRLRLNFRSACLSFSLQETFDSASKKLKKRVAANNHSKKSKQVAEEAPMTKQKRRKKRMVQREVWKSVAGWRSFMQRCAGLWGLSRGTAYWFSIVS